MEQYAPIKRGDALPRARPTSIQHIHVPPVAVSRHPARRNCATGEAQGIGGDKPPGEYVGGALYELHAADGDVSVELEAGIGEKVGGGSCDGTIRDT